MTLPLWAENLRRDELLLLARLTNRYEQYEDLISFMCKLVKTFILSGDLNIEERELLMSGFRRVIEVKISFWRNLWKEALTAFGHERELIESYNESVFKKVIDVSYQFHLIVDDYLIPNASSKNSQVYYFTMKAEVFGTVSEVMGADRIAFIGKAKMCYERAEEIAEDLHAGDSLRLELPLRYALFQYELKEVKGAHATVKKALSKIRLSGVGLDGKGVAALKSLKSKARIWAKELKNA